MAASKKQLQNEVTHVELQIRKTRPTQASGWKRCSSPSGSVLSYWCRYLGGDWSGGGPGGFGAKVGQGAKTVHLRLKAYAFWNTANPKSHGFRITGMNYAPANGQLSLKGNAPNQRQIIDLATVSVSEGSYEIRVAHKSSNGTVTKDIICDPGWRNTGGGR